MSFDLADISIVRENYRYIQESEPYKAHEIAEAAGRFAMGQTECSREELEQALTKPIDETTPEEKVILQHFYGFMDKVQR